MTSHERHGLSSDQQLDCLSSNFSGKQKQRKRQSSVLLYLCKGNPPVTGRVPYKGTVRLPHWPRQNGRHFADDIFRSIFLNENVCSSLKISMRFVSKVLNNNTPALVQIMAWRRPGDKPLSESVTVRLPRYIHICIYIYMRHSALVSWGECIRDSVTMLWRHDRYRSLRHWKGPDFYVV